VTVSRAGFGPKENIMQIEANDDTDQFIDAPAAIEVREALKRLREARERVAQARLTAGWEGITDALHGLDDAVIEYLTAHDEDVDAVVDDRARADAADERSEYAGGELAVERAQHQITQGHLRMAESAQKRAESRAERFSEALREIVEMPGIARTIASDALRNEDDDDAHDTPLQQ
jgi:hypothetical protein